jgi:hypothetical protein
LSDVSFHWYRTIGQTLMSRPEFYWWRKPEYTEKTTSLSQDKLSLIILYRYTLPWTRFELSTLVVIGTDCILICSPNCTNMLTRVLTREVEFILHLKLYHQYMIILIDWMVFNANFSTISAILLPWIYFYQVTDFKARSIVLASALKNNWKLVIDEKQDAFQTQMPMLPYHHS